MSEVKDRLRRATETLPPVADPFERLERRRDRRRRNDRLLAGVVAVVVAVGCIGGAVYALGRTGRQDHGKTAASNPAPALESGQYFYLKATRYLGEDGAKVWETTWWATDGSGKIESRTNRPDKYGPLPPGTYGAGDFPTAVPDIADLSTDPEELADQLRERSSAGGASPQPGVTPGGGLPLETGQLWRAIRFLLDQPDAAPQLRSALFAVASGLDGVDTVTDAVDPGGRPAVALELNSEEIHWTMYFDPNVYQLMSSHAVYDSGEAYIVFDSAVVSSNGDEPTADQWLFPPAQRLPSPPAVLTDPAA